MAYVNIRLTKESGDYLLTEAVENIFLEQTQLTPTIVSIRNIDLVANGQNWSLKSCKETLDLVANGQNWSLSSY